MSFKIIVPIDNFFAIVLHERELLTDGQQKYTHPVDNAWYRAAGVSRPTVCRVGDQGL
jgi:hypothetical protein